MFGGIKKLKNVNPLKYSWTDVERMSMTFIPD